MEGASVDLDGGGMRWEEEDLGGIEVIRVMPFYNMNWKQCFVNVFGRPSSSNSEETKERSSSLQEKTKGHIRKRNHNTGLS